MNSLDTKLNYLTHKLEILQTEETQLKEKQIVLGKEIMEFFNEHGCPPNSHPLQVIKYFRQKKVIETL